MADQDARALLLTIQANTELLRSNLSAAEKAIGEFTSSTQQHLDQSDARFATLGKSIEALEGPLERLKAVGEGAFAFLVGESLLGKGREALEFAGNIQFLSTQIGVSTDFLQKFRYAASQSGASVEVSNTALTRFSRSVGEAANGDTALIKLFNNLGVNVLDAGGKVRTVEGVFKDTADAIQKLPDPAQRVADTMTLMGRGAASLVPVLSAGSAGFNQLAAAAEQLGIVLGPELIEHSEQVNHKLAALKLILDAQMASAVAQNAVAIESLSSPKKMRRSTPGMRRIARPSSLRRRIPSIRHRNRSGWRSTMRPRRQRGARSPTTMPFALKTAPPATSLVAIGQAARPMPRETSFGTAMRAMSRRSRSRRGRCRPTLHIGRCWSVGVLRVQRAQLARPGRRAHPARLVHRERPAQPSTPGSPTPTASTARRTLFARSMGRRVGGLIRASRSTRRRRRRARRHPPISGRSIRGRRTSGWSTAVDARSAPRG